MNLTHLVMFSFLNGAGSVAITATAVGIEMPGHPLQFTMAGNPMQYEAAPGSQHRLTKGGRIQYTAASGPQQYEVNDG